jgi:hypothetical protein
MTDFVKEPAFEIGRRVDIRGPFSWLVVLKPAAEVEAALDAFVSEFSAFLGQPVRILSGIAPTLGNLRSDLTHPATDPVVISDLDQADAGFWRALDINRSGLLREGPVILWLSSIGLTGLCDYAPNIRSFVGGSIVYLGIHGDVMTASERQQRISDLESHFGIPSSEVIRRAEAGTLPTEPHYVEWLVLLDRGDLV